MSFSSDIKADIARIEIKKECCALSELCGIAHSCGTIELASGGMKLRFDVESNTLARRIYKLIKFRYNTLCDIDVVEGKRLNKHHKYRVYLNDTIKARELLMDTGIIVYSDEGIQISEKIPPNILMHTCCKRAFLAGIFQACGYVNNPKSSYHSEFLFKDEHLAKSVLALLHSEDFDAKLITRKGSYVVYLTSGESICDLLTLLGAHTAVMHMQNVRVQKDLYNNVNRRLNFDAANINKASSAAFKQMQNVLLIERAGQYPLLSNELKDAAEVRMDNPGASLSELAELLPDVTKSGMNHRFRKLEKIARSIEEEQLIGKFD